MIVDVVAVLVLQAAVDQEVDVVAVRNLLVPAIRTVAMAVPGLDPAGGIASVRVHRGYGDDMFLDMVTFGMQQMAAVEIVDMALVAHGRGARRNYGWFGVGHGSSRWLRRPAGRARLSPRLPFNVPERAAVAWP